VAIQPKVPSEVAAGADPSTPPDATPPRIEEPPHVAGGITAITVAMKHALGEMGAVRSFETLSHLNQTDGFDCPGCAWPDPDAGERTHNEYCENGAKAVAEEATTKRVTLEFFGAHSVAELSQQSDYWLGQQGRLTQPMFLEAGGSHYQPITWDKAFELIAANLNELSSPNRAVFYTSGRTSNEAAFLYQLFVRQFGTNNLPDCSNMCHESSGVALTEAIGIGKGTVTLKDFEIADAIFVIGQNPGTNHPRMLTSLQAAARRGCNIVHINPLPEVGLERFKHPQEVMHILGSGTKLAKLHLPVRINGDIALFKGIMKEMLEAEDRAPGTVLDRAFIEQKTAGFAELEHDLRQTAWEDVIANSGISRDEIRQAAEIAIAVKSIICCWAMGLTQHKNAVGTIQTVMNFLLLRGNVGRPGAGPCPVRGHSNVQGDRTVGIWERPKPELLDSLAKEFNFSPPREHGYDTVGAIQAMLDGKVDVFFAMGGNFLSATPDTEATAAALRRCKLTVHVSTKMNRAHLITGRQALILPCLGRTERDAQPGGAQFVSVENSMGIVHSSRGTLKPASEHLLSEPRIVARLAQATLGTRSDVPWMQLTDNYDCVRDLIAKTIPGFEDYNARVRKPGGFDLPNAPRDGRFPTANGKANFKVHAIPDNSLQPGEFMLTTIRSHDQFNTTIYGLDDRYRGIHGGRHVVFLHPDDMAANGWTRGKKLDLSSHYDGQTRTAPGFAAVPYKIPRRSAAAYFPEANVLVPLSHTAEKSNTPASKSVVIRIQSAGRSSL
jgi:molybdopterin-dependent oxidoreductase alpha subunit